MLLRLCICTNAEVVASASSGGKVMDGGVISMSNTSCLIILSSTRKVAAVPPRSVMTNSRGGSNPVRTRVSIRTLTYVFTPATNVPTVSGRLANDSGGSRKYRTFATAEPILLTGTSSVAELAHVGRIAGDTAEKSGLDCTVADSTTFSTVQPLEMGSVSW